MCRLSLLSTDWTSVRREEAFCSNQGRRRARDPGVRTPQPLRGHPWDSCKSELFGWVMGGLGVAAVNRQSLHLEPPISLKTWRRPCLQRRSCCCIKRHSPPFQNVTGFRHQTNESNINSLELHWFQTMIAVKKIMIFGSNALWLRQFLKSSVSRTR